MTNFDVYLADAKTVAIAGHVDRMATAQAPASLHTIILKTIFHM